MAFSLSDEWVSDVRRMNVTKLTPKQIKSEAFNLEKNGFYGHLIVPDAHKKVISLISATHDGYFLVHGVSQQLELEFKADFHPNDFIYVESEGDYLFVIIVADGNVMMDKALGNDDYELPFVSCMIQNCLKIATTLVISNSVDVNLFVGSSGISSEKILKKALTTTTKIQNIQIEKNTLKLITTNQLTIKKEMNYKPFVAVASFLILVGFWLFSGSAEEEKPRDVIDPYKKYTDILTNSGINSKTRFGYLYNDILALKTLTGWDVVTIDLEAKTSRIALKNNGGNYTELEAFSKKYQYLIQKVKDKYIAISQIKHSPILEKAVLVPPNSTLRYIEESGSDWLPNFKISNLSNPVSNQYWEEISFTVNIIDGWSKNDFDTLGTIVNIHPIGFLSGNLAFDKNNNTYKGSINFVIYGAKS
jgi:hypothetical protein